MTWLDRFALFSPLDAVALALLLSAWLGMGWRIERPGARHPSTSQIMAGYRREWMHQMITREPRIFDAQIVASLRQGTAFFASTAVIAIGGTLALIGNAERLTGIASDLALIEAPTFVWEAKLVVVALFLTNAFLNLSGRTDFSATPPWSWLRSRMTAATHFARPALIRRPK